MLSKWTQHIHDEHEKEAFRKYVRNSPELLDRLKTLIDEREKEITRSELSEEIYDTPSWEHRQAHKNGRRQELAWMRRLVDLDQQIITLKD